MATEPDLLLTEGRDAGRAYVNSFKGDWDALFADLNRRTEQRGAEGATVVTAPSPRPTASEKRLPTP